jgi:hypothetical protein
MLRPTVSRPVCLRMKHPSGAYDPIFIAVRQLRVCWCGALSLRRGRVCRLQLLLALASAVIFGSKSRGARDHIRDFLFRHLLRLAGSRWRYSTPPPHGFDFILTRTASHIKYRYPRQCLLITRIHGNVFRNELVSENPSPWKRVCQLVSWQWVYMSQYKEYISRYKCEIA